MDEIAALVFSCAFSGWFDVLLEGLYMCDSVLSMTGSLASTSQCRHVWFVIAGIRLTVPGWIVLSPFHMLVCICISHMQPTACSFQPRNPTPSVA